MGRAGDRVFVDPVIGREHAAGDVLVGRPRAVTIAIRSDLPSAAKVGRDRANGRFVG